LATVHVLFSFLSVHLKAATFPLFFLLLCSVAYPFNLSFFFMSLGDRQPARCVISSVSPASPSSWIFTILFCHVIGGFVQRVASTFACTVTVLQPPFFLFYLPFFFSVPINSVPSLLGLFTETPMPASSSSMFIVHARSICAPRRGDPAVAFVARSFFLPFLLSPWFVMVAAFFFCR
jgi:hypothetical protein